MKSSAVVLCCLLLLISLLPLCAAAETRYVSDQLVVTVRAGKGVGAETLATLRTDTPVEVLAESGDHARIRTEEGVEGYVQVQYLSSETPKPIVIARLEEERDQLTASLTQLQDVGAELEATREELQGLTATYEALLRESQHVVETVSERDRLQEENERLAVEVETLREENAALLRNGTIRWFLAGAGVLLVGWLIGRSSRKKRRGYGYA